MSKPKKFDNYKECSIRTFSDEYRQVFTSEWNFTDIRSWMIDTYCIDESSIIEIRISSTTIYKNDK